MQKYIAQHISQDTGQEHGGRRMMFGPECVYLAKDAEAELAAKDRDLADANHMLLAANASADSFRRVAEVAQNNLRALIQQARWLRRVAEEVDERRIAPGWANTCRMVADEIERMQPTSGASNG